MELLSAEQLKGLMSKQGAPCLSMFMPTHRTGGEIKQDQIRFKNLLRKAEERLATLGLRTQGVLEFLAPLQKLASNVLFWRKQIDGLALFVSREAFHSFSLPVSFEELVLISDRFHLKPLLPLFGQFPRYYLLALSQNQVRLYEGASARLWEVDVKGLPENMQAALQYDEPEKQVRFRGAAAGGGDRGALMSGHGAEIDDTKENLLKYFRQIDRALREYLRDETAPLVVAGVEYLFPIYKEVNNYSNMMEECIPGNPEELSPEVLHRQSWPIVKPFFMRAIENAVAQYRRFSGTGLASNDIEAIVAAASHKRVSHLFVARGARQWGFSDSERDFVKLLDGQEPGSEDLLDSAALHTYLSGGAVYVLPPEEMPDYSPLAAVLRY